MKNSNSNKLLAALCLMLLALVELTCILMVILIRYLLLFVAVHAKMTNIHHHFLTSCLFLCLLKDLCVSSQ